MVITRTIKASKNIVSISPIAILARSPLRSLSTPPMLLILVLLVLISCYRLVSNSLNTQSTIRNSTNAIVSSGLILYSWPHTGLLCELLISVRRHLPQISNFQYHPQTDFSEPVFVRKYELDQALFLICRHLILAQHTLSAYLTYSQHSISHGVNGQIQVMTSGLQS